MPNELVTFFLFTYNHENFIGPSIDSALAQTYEPMDIFIWDNCSTDKTPQIIKKRLSSYQGPHQVYFHENKKNLYPGLGMINTAVPMLKGNFVVLLSGDDISVPDRVERLVAARRETGASALSSSHVEIDSQGREGDFISSLNIKRFTPLTTLEHFIRNGGSSACVGSGLAFDKAVFDYFGPLRDGPRNGDVMIPFRGALLSSTYYIDELLLYRRIHTGNTDLGIQIDEAKSELEQIVLKERQVSNRIANWIKMLEDFDFFARKHPDDPRNLPAIREHLIGRIVKVARRWVNHRYQMMMDGIGIV
jgi:glycosyltransferase involved in cell wall biosynthesis